MTTKEQALESLGNAQGRVMAAYLSAVTYVLRKAALGDADKRVELGPALSACCG
jgi:hypothetical protein